MHNPDIKLEPESNDRRFTPVTPAVDPKKRMFTVRYNKDGSAIKYGSNERKRAVQAKMDQVKGMSKQQKQDLLNHRAKMARNQEEAKRELERKMKASGMTAEEMAQYAPSDQISVGGQGK